jgi:hypothetical protein
MGGGIQDLPAPRENTGYNRIKHGFTSDSVTVLLLRQSG